MNEEEKFDELISSRLLERDFPFDELNWDEAERLIIQQERRAKITRVTLTFAAGLAAGVIIMLPFIINTHITLTNDIVSKSAGNQNMITQTTIAPTADPSQLKTNTPNNTKETTPLPVQSAFVKKDTRTGIRSVYSPVSSPVVKISNDRKPLLAVDNKPLQLPAKSNLIASGGAKPEPLQNVNHTEPNHTEEAANTSSQTVNNPAVENTTPSVNNAQPEKTIPINPMPVTEKNNDNTVVPSTTPANTAPTPTTGSNKNIAGNSTTSKMKPDTNTAALPPMLRTDPPPKSNNDHSSNILSVYAGGNYSFGWNDEGTKEGNGITPWGGFNFTHYFGNTLSAVLGFGFSELNHLDQTYSNSVVQYDFGTNAEVTSVSPLTVYYVNFPLKLQYTAGGKNIFGIGINYMLLITTYSALATSQQTYFSETPSNSSKQLGYTQGFSNSDMQLTLSYTRMFTGRLGIGAEYYYDNNYLENNTVTGINQFTKNSGLRVFLTFQLVK